MAALFHAKQENKASGQSSRITYFVVREDVPSILVRCRQGQHVDASSSTSGYRPKNARKAPPTTKHRGRTGQHTVYPKPARVRSELGETPRGSHTV